VIKMTGNEYAAELKEKTPEITDLDLLLNTWYYQTENFKDQFILLFKELKKEGCISNPSSIVYYDKLQKDFDKFWKEKKYVE